MSLLLMESCDLPAVVGAKWSTIAGGVNFAQTQQSRTCWSLPLSDEDALKTRGFGADESNTITLGCRVLFTDLRNNDTNAMFTFRGDGDTVTHISVEFIDNSDTIGVYRGGTQIATASAGISVDTWYFLEIQVVIHDSTGSVIVKVDESEIINFSGDTRNGGTDALIDRVWLGHNNAVAARYFRDLYIVNDAGASLNDFLGPVTIEARLADGAGNYTAWTPNSGANYAAVDDPGANDGDTTYVESTTAADRDSYTFEDASAVTTDPVAVAVHAVGRYDAAPLDVAAFLRRSSTDDDGTAVTPGGSYTTSLYEIWETDPIAAAAWTLANFNATEFGIVSS